MSNTIPTVEKYEAICYPISNSTGHGPKSKRYKRSGYHPVPVEWGMGCILHSANDEKKWGDFILTNAKRHEMGGKHCAVPHRVLTSRATDWAC